MSRTVKQTIEQLTNRLNSNIDKAETQLRWAENSIVLHNTVCAFPETLLTIATKNGKAVISGNVIATQFTNEAAKDICKAISNGLGEHPIPMFYTDYYKAVIKQANELLETLVSC